MQLLTILDMESSQTSTLKGSLLEIWQYSLSTRKLLCIPFSGSKRYWEQPQF